MSHAEFIAVAEEAVGVLKKLKGKYPHLVSPYVEAAINNWDKYFSGGFHEAQVKSKMERAEREALARLAAELLKTHQMEDVLQQLSEEFSVSIDYIQLIDLIGKDAYMISLSSEIALLEENSISREQIAELWNNLGKPVLGGVRWTESDVSSLVHSVNHL